MASGINNTFRQVGIATGIAALGAIFQSQIASSFASHCLHELADSWSVKVRKPVVQAVASGQVGTFVNAYAEHSSAG